MLLNNDENPFIRTESENLFFFLKENDKEVQTILLEVITKQSKSTYHGVHHITFIFWLFNTNVYRDKDLDEAFVRKLKKKQTVNKDLS